MFGALNETQFEANTTKFRRLHLQLNHIHADPMITLESITPGLALTGLEPTVIGVVVAVVPIADGVIRLIYQTPDGSIKDRLLNRADLASIAVAVTQRPWSFDGNGEDFKLAVEAKRIDLAFLFDPMMAVHTSNVEPLPHQITAVYESMLPRQPLRFILADDPGAGKTIMAGLYISELILRADARRVLIVAPGSLVEQWRDEMFEKFGLEFQVFRRDLETATQSGNPFEDIDRLIVRLDQLARNEALQEKLCNAGWDLAIFDEAHKLSAHFFNNNIEKTGRFKFAERLGAHTRHLLLMTATPHSGKEEDFQLFLSLLDSDRFYRQFRDGVDKTDASDLMRRMVKEKLVKFDGTPLFPERRAYTVNYELSELENVLYEAVTKYVTEEFGKADALDGRRQGSIGFALTSLQRRLASSPEAIYQSLKHRRERLERRLNEERARREDAHTQAQPNLYENFATAPEDDDDLSAEEQENLEENLIAQATAAQTTSELADEIGKLKRLEQQASTVVGSEKDRKWDELSKILQHSPELFDANGRLRKIIIFTEHRDTLNYLHKQITRMRGRANEVVVIHGGIHRDARREAQTRFWSDPEVRVLIATDAAGEGINLQNAHLMVNYDLPWNPNRLEQRFGRIHRIGQQEVCHLWNLVANKTREGQVFSRLLQKLEVVSTAMQGQIFNILGEVFDGKSLKELLIEAIRYSERPEIRAKLNLKIDAALDLEHIRELLSRDALAQESMSAERLFRVKEEMEQAEARRLQPYFVRSFFLKAFATEGGSIYPRERDRFEITFVPEALRERSRMMVGRNRRDLSPVIKRYERVCFTKDAVRPSERPGLAPAQILHPGHPLMLALSDVILEKHANLLRQGSILVDPLDDGLQPALLFLLTHDVKSGDGQVISTRLQFVRVLQDGSATFAGWAPHLDLEPLAATDRPLLNHILNAAWLTAGLDQRALALAASILVPEHFKEVAERRIAQVDKTLAAVHQRLSTEIRFLSDRYLKLTDDKAAGKDVRLTLENMRRTLSDLESRLESRKRELQSMRHVTSATPVLLSGALIVPIGLIRKLRGEPAPDAVTAPFSADPVARSRIEMLAMNAVRRAEETRGCRVVDVSAQKCGWDLTSYGPAVAGKLPEPRHIEVKGRIKGATTVTVTKNEIFHSWNQGPKYHLAIVLVGEDDSIDGPHYVPHPFREEPGWAVSSVNYDLKVLLARAQGI